MLNMFINKGELGPPITNAVSNTNCPGGPTFPLGETVAGDIDMDCILTYRDLNIDLSQTDMLFGVTDVNANGFIDVEDLLAVFGTGTDSDGNDVPDDITGSDFSAVYDPFDPMMNVIEPMRATPVLVDLEGMDGHGTGMAGLIGAMTDQPLPLSPPSLVAGVAWNVRILPIRCGVIGCDLTTIGLALGYAAQMGAQVANLSLGAYEDLTPDPNPPARELSDRLAILGSAITYFDDPSSLLLVWAVFEGKIEFLPVDCDADIFYCSPSDAFANEPNAVTVTPTTFGDELTTWAGRGDTNVHIAAPGGAEMVLLSSTGGAYVPPFGGGASSATGLVSGVAALLVAQDPVLRSVRDPARVKAAILDGADVLGSLGGLVQGGRRLNASGALSQL